MLLASEAPDQSTRFYFDLRRPFGRAVHSVCHLRFSDAQQFDANAVQYSRGPALLCPGAGDERIFLAGAIFLDRWDRQ